MHVPKPPHGATEPQGSVAITVIESPAEGCSNVVVVHLEPVDPDAGLGTRQMWLSRLHLIQIMRGVGLSCSDLFSTP